MRRIVLVGFSLAAGLLACCGGNQYLGTSWNVYGIQPLDPGPQYEQHYHQMEDCLHKAGDFEAVRWESASLIESVEKSCRHPAGVDVTCKARALTVFPHRIIMHVESINDYSTVRHEAIHHILQRAGHPDEEFRCTYVQH